MTTSNDANIEGGAGPGTSLTPTLDGGVEPFLAAAGTASPDRGFGARLLDYSAHIAIVVGLIGFAWTVSSHLASRPTAAQIESPTKVAAAAPKTADEMTQLRETNAKMAADIKALRANVDTLRATVKQDRTASQMHMLEADLKSVKSGLTSTRSETDAALAQLTGKLDKLQQEPQSKVQQLADRVGRLEHQGVDTTSTGSIPPSSTQTVARTIPAPPAKPTSVKLADADESVAKPQVISGWVVRDVYDGVALIEGRHGPMEVVPGVSIPGAGVVKSIARKGNGWTVTTSKGLLAYAAPPHDYRRVPPPREYYAPYPSEY